MKNVALLTSLLALVGCGEMINHKSPEARLEEIVKKDIEKIQVIKKEALS